MSRLDQIPASWYALVPSDAVLQDQIAPVSFLDRDLVLYRDSDGQVHALDAYCSHRGSHFAKDGILHQQGILCRSHQKFFEHSGRCKNDARCPSLKTFDVIDKNGLIMIWHDPAKSEIKWEMPGFVPLQSGQYSQIFWKILPKFETHVSILLQDVFDNGHFEPMHGLMHAQTDVSGEKNLLKTHTRAQIKLSRFLEIFSLDKPLAWFTKFLEKWISLRVELHSEVYGMGLVAYEVEIRGLPKKIKYLLLSAGTPNSPSNLTVSLGICTEKTPFRFLEAFLARCLLRVVAEGYEEDRSRWEGQLRSQHQVTSVTDDGIAYYEASLRSVFLD